MGGMEPAEFGLWVGSITGLLMGLAKVLAYLAETFGLRASDRRADRVARLQECEHEIARLKTRVAELEEALREERDFTDRLERMFVRAGLAPPERPEPRPIPRIGGTS